MKKLSLSEEQMAVLEKASRRHPDAHVRSRALAVRAVAIGCTREQVAQWLPFSAYSVGQWAQAYARDGLDAFAIRPGRGRRSQVNEEEVRDYLRSSPLQFGLEQSRWTLRALGEVCPCLQGMSEQGIHKVLHRLGFSYKHGQTWITSPDPDYAEKKTPSPKRTSKHEQTRR